MVDTAKIILATFGAQIICITGNTGAYHKKSGTNRLRRVSKKPIFKKLLQNALEKASQANK